MNRRESLKLMFGMLFLPLLKWLPKEKVVVKPIQKNRELIVAILRLLPPDVVKRMHAMLLKDIRARDANC